MVTHLVLTVDDSKASEIINEVLAVDGVSKVGVYEDMKETDFVFEQK